MKFQVIDKNYDFLKLLIKIMIFWIWIEMKKTGMTIQIQNPIFNIDCKSQSNPLNWIAIRIEQSSNTLNAMYYLNAPFDHDRISSEG